MNEKNMLVLTSANFFIATIRGTCHGLLAATKLINHPPFFPYRIQDIHKIFVINNQVKPIVYFSFYFQSQGTYFKWLFFSVKKKKEMKHFKNKLVSVSRTEYLLWIRLLMLMRHLMAEGCYLTGSSQIRGDLADAQC